MSNLSDLAPLARPHALSEDIAAELARRIDTGEFGPGARLPTEKTLAETFGVSRPVVREAIARLRNDGLVETRQGAGAFVAANPRSLRLKFDALPAVAMPVPAAKTGRSKPRPNATTADNTAALREIFELRALLEPVVAELAARRAQPADLAAMQASLDAMDAALAAGTNAARADDAFHNALAAATGNRRVTQLMDFLGAHFSGTREVAWQADADGSAPYSAAAQAEHHALFAAVASGAAPQARRRSLAHVRGVARRAGIELPADLGGTREKA
ncbi:FadR/GntR family transcriptional regulator [Derxia lacustris]|uniref:FadR/GntR family transcriptional regulator n=1 Tax=Derxia lacustris TaxID=764842 RepID=UPI000A16D249|nr:FadR/GntR family transcriptional regulator [Derxia lacustris]